MKTQAMKTPAVALALVLCGVSLGARAVSEAFIQHESPALVNFCTENVQPKHVTILTEDPQAKNGPAASNDPRMIHALNQFLTVAQKKKIDGPVSRSVIRTSSGKFINFYQCQAHWCAQESLQILVDPRTRKTYGLIYEESETDRTKASYQFFGHPDKTVKGYLKGLTCADYNYLPKPKF